MADVKISGLPASTTPLAGTEVLPIVQGGQTRQVSVNNLTAGKAVSATQFNSTVATGTAPLTVASTTEVANLRAANATSADTANQVKSNATTGVLQVVGPAAGQTRTMTTPDANFTVARTDAGQTFTGTQTFSTPIAVGSGGTGLNTLSTGRIPYGNGTGAFSSTADFNFDGTSLTIFCGGTNAKLNAFNANRKYIDFQWYGNSIGSINQSSGTFIAIDSPILAFQTGGVERARVHASGGVSIGNTTDPGAGNLSVSGSINIDPGTANSTTYNQVILKGGAASGNGIGYMKRQTTPSVANSATDILGVGSFGALVIVTGVGSGAIFSDLLMVSYNGAAVVSSNTQQGGPASRTYTTASGFLRLTMGSATAMAITAQSLETGGTGA